VLWEVGRVWGVQQAQIRLEVALPRMTVCATLVITCLLEHSLARNVQKGNSKDSLAMGNVVTVQLANIRRPLVKRQIPLAPRARRENIVQLRDKEMAVKSVLLASTHALQEHFWMSVKTVLLVPHHPLVVSRRATVLIYAQQDGRDPLVLALSV